ncbi:hypothetical protein PUR61_05110, partial [Streptomyces sp. BE20]|nr:hypothetical protein [Streptomyces sp. BE20]
LTARDGARPLARGLMPAPAALALQPRVNGDDRPRTEPAAATEHATASRHHPHARPLTPHRLPEPPPPTGSTPPAAARHGPPNHAGPPLLDQLAPAPPPTPPPPDP